MIMGRIRGRGIKVYRYGSFIEGGVDFRKFRDMVMGFREL